MTFRPESTNGVSDSPAIAVGESARPQRRRIGRRRTPTMRFLVALTSGGALVVVAALVAAAAVIPPVGARRAARDLASRELELQVSASETEVGRVFVSQRRWTDMWRESFGVLVATDRRLLFVSAPPSPMLRPRDEGPDELQVESYGYDQAFTLETRNARWPYNEGLILRTVTGSVDFIVDDTGMQTAKLLVESTSQARREITVQIQRQQAAAVTAAPPPAVYVPYVVRRGETLTGLARRFNTTTDVLRQLNMLQTDAIQAGQRLRVPAVDSIGSTNDNNNR